MTRQLLPYNTTSETIMFVLTVIVGYGIWILYSLFIPQELAVILDLNLFSLM